MKRKSILVLIVAAVVLLASCGGVSDYGTPTELVGTWNGATKETLSSFNVAEKASYYAGYDYEGTWEYKDTTYPPKEEVYVYSDGDVRTTYPDTDDMVTTEISHVRVIAANGSYEDTSITKSTREKIEEVAYDDDWTDGKVTNGRDAQDASVTTQTIVTTVTVTENADGSYMEKKVVKTTDSYVSGSTSITTTETETSYETNLFQPTCGKIDDPVTSDNVWLENSNLEHTVKVDKIETSYVTDRSYSLVINEDGTYTGTYTYKETKNVDEASRTYVTVDSGFIIGKPETETTKGTLTAKRTARKQTLTVTGDWEQDETVEIDDTVTTFTADYNYYVAQNKLRTGFFAKGILTLAEEK